MPPAARLAATAPRSAAALLAMATVLAAAPAELPKVALSDQHREMCRVGVGDTLPELALQTPNGDTQPLRPLLGKAATVVAFYEGEGWMTRSLLRDLGPDVAEPFGARGVVVVAVGQGKASANAAGCLSLVDTAGEAAAKIGEGRMPRVYVVDAAGKIVWFDIEYSRSTRRELRQSLAAVLGEDAQAVAETPRAPR